MINQYIILLEKNFLNIKNTEYDELYQIGSVALLLAIDKFDDTKILNFQHLCIHIYEYLLTYVRENTLIKYSRNIIDSCSKLIKQFDENNESIETKINNLNCTDLEKIAIYSRFNGVSSLNSIINLDCNQDEYTIEDTLSGEPVDFLGNIIYNDLISSLSNR